MLKKVVWHSVATALASIVFPVPGGPNISRPCAQDIFSRSGIEGHACLPRPANQARYKPPSAEERVAGWRHIISRALPECAAKPLMRVGPSKPL